MGFKSVHVNYHLPLNIKNSVVTNTIGMVEGREGLYVAGWVGTGPRAVIIIDTTNTAFKVVLAIVEDIKRMRLEDRLARWGVEEECRTGEEKGKPRDKMLKVEDMLSIAQVAWLNYSCDNIIVYV